MPKKGKLTKREKILLEIEERKRLREREANKKPFDLLALVEATHPNYKAGWFHKLLCKKLEDFISKVEQGLSPRLIINVPPQHGKSTIVSEKFPVYALSKHPEWPIIVASYASSLAERFSRRARDAIKDQFIRLNAPHLALSKDKQGVEEWETTARGGFKAVGIQGAITGNPARIIVIDDPIKNQEEAYSQTIREKIWENYVSAVETRLAPGGGIIIMQTRWHKDDLTGRILDRFSDKWEQLVFPAIADKDEYFDGELVRSKGEGLHPERYSIEFYENIKSLSGWAWDALYMQRPVSPEGGLLKRSWWQYYDELPPIEKFERFILSTDAAFKGMDARSTKDKQKEVDYVVIQIWGKIGANVYLIDQVRAQLEFTDSLRAHRVILSKHPYVHRKLIEEKANGAAIISVLNKEIGGFIGVNPEGSKEARVQSVSPYIESGNAYLPNPKFNSWVEGFINECADFPKGKHDDQVDAMSQALKDLFGGFKLVFA